MSMGSGRGRGTWLLDLPLPDAASGHVDQETRVLRRATLDCESPIRSRMLDTEGTVVTRPCSPRLSCRRPSRISIPICRFVSATDLFPALQLNPAGFLGGVNS